VRTRWLERKKKQKEEDKGGGGEEEEEDDDVDDDVKKKKGQEGVLNSHFAIPCCDTILYSCGCLRAFVVT
jgi:hypothetical protein